jgi:hypothetical protein
MKILRQRRGPLFLRAFQFIPRSNNPLSTCKSMLDPYQDYYYGAPPDYSAWMGAPSDPSCEVAPDLKSSLGTFPL